MDRTYWHKQTTEPLFPDIVWSRPENKQSAGKLLILGGNIHGFAAVGQAYLAAQKAGVGQIRIVLPDVLQKTVSKLMPEADYAASTPSGSFSQKALGQIIDESDWADGVIVAGDLGRNSETVILLEKLTSKYTSQLTLTKDAVDYFLNNGGAVLERNNTLLVLTIAQLQSFSKNIKFHMPFKYDMDLIKLVDTLHEFSVSYPASIIVKHLDNLFVAVDGEVSTTKNNLREDESWRIPVAASSAVWWLQNPNKTFEALTSSLQV